MSLTKIQSSRRIAIWEVHSRRCIYCNQIILYNDLEIDHIIPEHLTKAPKRLDIVTKSYGLNNNFDLNSFDNLLPVHHTCNSRKTGLLLKKSTALYYLAIAAAKAKQAAIEEQAILRRSRRDRVLASLQVALEAGEMSRSDVIAITNKIESGTDALETIHELQFSNRIVKGLLNQSDVDKLLDEPILPRKYGLDELTHNAALMTRRFIVPYIRVGNGPSPFVMVFLLHRV
jgi:5-methylcytosine-specific restriction endonuclease McrA